MNNFCRDFENLLLNVDTVLICLQKGNDLDTSSSALGLAKLLELNAPSIKNIKLIQVHIESKILSNIKDYAYSTGEKIEPSKTLFITVDINTKDQILHDTYKLIKDCYSAVKIDHHEDSEPIGSESCPIKEISFVDPEYNSCSEMIWDIAKELKWKTNKEIAEILFYGLYGDSRNLTSEQVNSRTFKIMSEMAKKGVEIPQIIRSLQQNHLKHIKIVGKLIETLEMQGNLAILNLNPEIVYEYYPQNFKTNGSRRIAQKKLLTFPLNIVELLLKANTIIYIHYCLISPFNNNKKFVFVVLLKPNETLEHLLLLNQFKKHRNRFSRRMEWSELVVFLDKNKELLIQ